MRKLADLVADGPIVLTFNRGSWYSFCRDELDAWCARAGQLAESGLRLVSVSPEMGGRLELLRNLVGLKAAIWTAHSATVRYAFMDPDFRVCTEPDPVFASLE
jgi:hypothetical protein